ncbi:MAG: hypothetical protein GTN38_03250 [Candidatus Aenigmarchaeota archaeon]|nr:hypothetical protein [Candidatus Aenigmarchaeota archaeon]NIP40678.1 hypothetical protein [Candidatus Aenigmarchaeota archaeon]NIQ18484.1 hypothetical protein [Candidatus Aenigmarchaeota archaeon]NIS73383.1 hypothetical protein [Candidatus Aenigmarchaeota archaeon]
MAAFDQLIQNMMNLEFFQFLFPFLLALAIVYGVLSWALKEQLPKSARGVISLIIAFFVMLYSSWNYMVVSFFANISGGFLIVGSGILFIIILMGLVGLRPEDLWPGKEKGKSKWIVVLLVVFIGALIFFGAGGSWLVGIPGWAAGSDFWTIIFFVIILAIVVFWMGAEKEDREEEVKTPGKP